MFSSFTAYNQIFHFSDIIALFPLLLIAMEELCENKRRCVFALTVCFMALLNYYFFAGQAVFCVIYFFVRFFNKNLIVLLKKLLSVAIEAVIGFAMSFIFLLPVLLYLSASSKAMGIIDFSDMLIFGDGFIYLKLIQSAFMVPDSFFFTSLFPSVDKVYPFGNHAASVAAYLPLFSAAENAAGRISRTSLPGKQHSTISPCLRFLAAKPSMSFFRSSMRFLMRSGQSAVLWRFDRSGM